MPRVPSHVDIVLGRRYFGSHETILPFLNQSKTCHILHSRSLRACFDRILCGALLSVSSNSSMRHLDRLLDRVARHAREIFEPSPQQTGLPPNQQYDRPPPPAPGLYCDFRPSFPIPES
ncbi:hypothetical protein BO94DRAFT_535541 [Aspergillus sclerotioniger CBS 115572]|uniref:Uncharacterized protein n=1 Tax=Aspergillus sclerotioniger CBS 115572 TaxID=1450535 RepID=A0A317WKZ5_9EURO|nr:hypothetical protein BO94DRAFT_535541 [Aspergillus sclerotioniger CBS 115572]PWY86381.1 hypothetical protein BO94DRAFT_535541 [Aspergillus sclerotioniger CBS 115572]